MVFPSSSLPHLMPSPCLLNIVCDSLLIGPPGAGKSTTMQCLLSISSNQSSVQGLRSHSDPDRPTRGIDIQSLSLPSLGTSHELGPLEVCLLDFGGHIEYRCLQESMLDLNTYFAVLVLSAFGLFSPIHTPTPLLNSSEHWTYTNKRNVPMFSQMNTTASSLVLTIPWLPLPSTGFKVFSPHFRVALISQSRSIDIVFPLNVILCFLHPHSCCHANTS